jgi:uncharacterized membrane protein
MGIYLILLLVIMMYSKHFKNTVKLQDKDREINNFKQIRRKTECKALNMHMEVE